MDYAKTIILNLPYDQAVPRVKEAFKAQGFGTLTEIDVYPPLGEATLKDKLDVDIEPSLQLAVQSNDGLAVAQLLRIECAERIDRLCQHVRSNGPRRLQPASTARATRSVPNAVRIAK